MKRFISLLFITLLASAVLCVGASASDFDAAAEKLSVIGMFRGTANGFELDRAPTRSEAAIMLVRLYGAEETAKIAYEAGEISHPFTDVSDFTSPYVAWLYTNGITNGFTETTYASQRICSAQNYVVFLLRALGYKDGKDFQYEDAFSFAQSKGFYDPLMFSGAFLRDDLAALTYQALAADTADGKTYLLKKLITDGAIDADAAKPMTETMEAYRAMNKSMQRVDQSSMDLDWNTQLDMTTTIIGETISASADVTGSMQLITRKDGSMELAYLAKTTSDGITSETSLWHKDGRTYLSTTENDETIRIQYADDQQDALLSAVQPPQTSALDVTGLALLESISAQKSGSGTIYTMAVNQSPDGLGSMAENDGDMTFSPVTAVYTVDSLGRLKAVDMTFDAAAAAELPVENGTPISLEMQYAYRMSMKINAVGSKVKIRWPNFDLFQEVSTDTVTGLLPS